HNLELSYNYYTEHCAGTPTPLTAKALVETYKLNITSKELSDLKEEITEKRLRKEDIKFMPNALNTLEYFYKLEIPMFLVTGSVRNDVDFILEKTGIKKYFKFSITRSEVEKSKPHPESYLKAIEKSNFNPNDFLVFEDTKNGVESAKLSGLRCFAIQEMKEMHKKLKHADKIFENFDKAILYLEKEGLL
uniref:HAD family hydrolase n=1 Tax=Mariniflexile sp. TaxID=1979402 RepID=UPI004047FBFF